MNILFVSGIYPPDIGGPATYVSRMAFELSQLGHSVEVLTLGERNERYLNPFPVRKVPRGNNILLRCLRLLAPALDMTKRADILYATGSPWDTWLSSVVAARISGKPLVLKVVGDSVWEWAQRKSHSDLLMGDFNKRRGKPILELLKWFRNYVARRADLIVTPSAFLGGVVEQWGIQAKKTKVIFNAVENPFQEKTNHYRRQREVITVARMVPWKGIEGLIRIADLLPEDIKLVIIGDGPLMAPLKAKVMHEGLDGKVTFAGRLSKDDVLMRLSRSPVFVLNSRYEGFPHTVLEAMACGAAVVATNVGGNAEVIKDGKNGFLVSVGDEKGMAEKINLLLQDEFLRRRLAEEALKSISDISWGKIAAETETLLSNVVTRQNEIQTVVFNR